MRTERRIRDWNCSEDILNILFSQGPVGAVNLHYGEKYNDLSYNRVLVKACREKGIAAFTGDGTDPQVMQGAAAAIREAEGLRCAHCKAME